MFTRKYIYSCSVYSDVAGVLSAAETIGKLLGISPNSVDFRAPRGRSHSSVTRTLSTRNLTGATTCESFPPIGGLPIGLNRCPAGRTEVLPIAKSRWISYPSYWTAWDERGVVSGVRGFEFR
jgi:hypothetical protein